MTENKYALLQTLKNSGLDLVAYVVERDFQNAMDYIEKGDLVGYGVLGLIEAARRYDPLKGVSFPTFACKKARHSIMGFLRQKCQRRYRYLEEINPVWVFSPDRADEYDDEDEKAYVRHMVNNLPGPHRRFAERYYLEDMTVKEFLKATSLKRHRVFQLRTQTLALLQVKMAHE